MDECMDRWMDGRFDRETSSFALGAGCTGR